MMKIAEGAQLCITVTKLNAIVVAKSAFNSSMNYESVMIFGKAKLLKDDEKMAAMTAISDVLVPGMSSYARALKPKEVAGTMIVEVPLTKYSAKSRTGGVVDEPEDKELPIWSGVIPLTTLRGAPVTADDSAGITVPPHIK
jgi:nitroimidazol reductase NimA-like FMN-containing flavoprotein (pyridoxamine 5'-phosphate oxidase superfamily)